MPLVSSTLYALLPKITTTHCPMVSLASRTEYTALTYLFQAELPAWRKRGGSADPACGNTTISVVSTSSSFDVVNRQVDSGHAGSSGALAKSTHSVGEAEITSGEAFLTNMLAVPHPASVTERYRAVTERGPGEVGRGS